MTITELNNDETIISKATEDSVKQYFSMLRNELQEKHTFLRERYVDLGIKIVRILIYDDDMYDKLLDRYLSYSVCETARHYDSTIVLFKNMKQKEDKVQLRYIMTDVFSKITPAILFDGLSGKMQGYDWMNNIHYFGYRCLEPEEITKEGHFLVREFYRILKTSHSSLVHGACVGLKGQGALICARGMCGKSTLSVLSLLKGFEYVSDDLMVLDREDDGMLYTYPIYSVIAISPQMYTSMYDDFQGGRFISNNSYRDKYIVNIANYHSSFRSHYPIRVCIAPQIEDDAQPSIIRCCQHDKGRAINRIVHSTINQVDDIGDNSNILKLINLLKDKDFYNFRLSHDIYRNVECLREFLMSLESTN